MLIPLLLTLACDTSDSQESHDDSVEETPWAPVTIDPNEWAPELLSETNLMRWDGEQITYNDGVVPYTLQTPLFSDYALKERAIWMPPGTAATWDGDGNVLDFPVGTVILKTFLFPSDIRSPDEDVRIIETRMLLLGDDGWASWPYLWRTDGSEADRHVSGHVEAIDFVDADGATRTAQYLVPQRNQCADCHDQYDENGEGTMMPIGPRPRNLNGPSVHIDGAPNQLTHLIDAGVLSGAPADLAAAEQAVRWEDVAEIGVDNLTSEQVVHAARDYLDINCAHCHSPKGVEGVTSQFFLNYDNTDEFNLGICKRPGSAGEGGENREFDIIPGDPEQSILWFRTDTEDIGAMMPDIGRSLTHTPASDLIWRWIEEMEPRDCE
ncbi:MAG: SO2930 family diheme c-type cytochrome [Myxococcota bacterium]